MKGLVHVQKKLRKIQARRRWKRVIKIVKATVRIRLMVNSPEDTIESIPIETQNEILKTIIRNWLGIDFDLKTEMLSINEEMKSSD